jgi:nucleoside-diphosphate-sugar epimerase
MSLNITSQDSTKDSCWSFENDLDTAMAQLADDLPALKGANIFLTGGTGFIGVWMLELIRHLNARLDLGIAVSVLTRSAAGFAKKMPHLAAEPAFRFIDGNVIDFSFDAVLADRPFTHMVHAATDASADVNENNPLLMFDTVVTGTRHTLDFARARQIPRILYLSSGAVYGRQPWEMELVGEDWLGAPDCIDARNAYAEGKRASEMLCAIYAKQFKCNIVTARIFALLGPHLNLGIHFAAGNFIRDALSGKEITINGDGKPQRSYLYAGDLTVWLFSILLKAQAGAAYNVGSDESVSIAELAALTASEVGNGQYKILGLSDSGWNPGRYAPDTTRIRKDLGVKQTVSLAEAIRRTAIWNGWKGKNA